MKGSSTGNSVIVGVLAAFAASTPTGSQASQSDASALAGSRQEMPASPAAIEIIKQKAAMGASGYVRYAADFVDSPGPSWVESGKGARKTKPSVKK